MFAYIFVINVCATIRSNSTNEIVAKESINGSENSTKTISFHEILERLAPNNLNYFTKNGPIVIIIT